MDKEFSHREVPWMKAGVAITEKVATAAEAAELGGLNFETEIWNLQAIDPDGGDDVTATDRFAVVRKDTREILSVCGTRYNILDYGQAFDFMDSISPEFVAAGVRRGGREGYMVVKAPDHIQVMLAGGVDPHDLYVVLRTSHDGSKKIEASVMGLRNKCTNMLSLRGFATGAERSWGIRHTSTMREKLAELETSLQNIDVYVKDLEMTTRTLLETPMSDAEARRLVTWALPNRPKRDDNVEAVMNLYTSSPTNEFRGNAWGLINALTEWLDWGKTYTSMDARFINGLAGFSHKTANRVAGRILTGG
jgi:phage/plasmid-like protein (TIGR03299 family)